MEWLRDHIPKGRNGSIAIIGLIALALLGGCRIDTPPDITGGIGTAAPSPTATSDQTGAPERVEARVVRVVDGDTIRVSVGGHVYTVRYIGIDTPETKHPSKPVQWMGPEATRANQELVAWQTIYLEKDVSETDRYGRLLRYVFLADGTFVNAELVRTGYAHAVTYPPDVKYQDLLLQMQVEAREQERGLWGPTPTPIPPTRTPVPTASAP